MRTIQLRIRCGKLTCAESPGVFCQYLRRGLDGSRPNCALFNARLRDDIQRCDMCLSIDTDATDTTKTILESSPASKGAPAAMFQCGTCGRVVESVFGSDEQCLACDRADLEKGEKCLLQHLREGSGEEIPTLDVSVEAAALLGDLTDKGLEDIINYTVQIDCKSDLMQELWETIGDRLRRSSRGSMRSKMYKGPTVSKDRQSGCYPPPPDHLWFLIDVSNSSGDGVKNYGRFFLSKKGAGVYMLEQNSDSNKADLIGPFHYKLEDRR